MIENEKSRSKRASNSSNERKPNLNAGSFKRGQTISGYDKENSERAKNRQLIVRRRKMTGFLSALAFCSILILILISQTIAKVGVVDSDGKKIDNAEDYTKIIQNYLEKQPAERLISYLKTSDLLLEIQKKHPEVAEISAVKKKSILDGEFYLKMRKPVAVWSVNDRSLYVDEKGVAFEKNFFEKPNLTVDDESLIEANNGKTIASNGFLGFIGRIISASSAKNLKITKITIPPASLRQVQVSFEGVDFPVKMLTTNSPEGQVENLAIALEYFKNNGISPKYLDLRVEGRGYYK